MPKVQCEAVQSRGTDVYRPVGRPHGWSGGSGSKGPMKATGLECKSLGELRASRHGLPWKARYFPRSQVWKDANNPWRRSQGSGFTSRIYTGLSLKGVDQHPK